MRLATRANGKPNGELVVVPSDSSRCLVAGAQVPSLLCAIDDWGAASTQLERLAERLDQGGGDTLDPTSLMAPLPRSWQWLDGSAFQTHADLMQVAFDTDALKPERPLMYQGMSDRLIAAREDVEFTCEEGGIDFEGEFGVIVDAVPMGTSPAEALKHLRLVVQINDWSPRAYAVPEMKTGFGFILASPPARLRLSPFPSAVRSRSSPAASRKPDSCVLATP